MPTSLFVEHHADGLAFYINGDLQFDTADEALYHEHLVVPAVALAVKRFPQKGLRVLICGGGDGLAARDVLRFPEVTQIDLVDYNPEVLELGRTIFQPFNQGSLSASRLRVYEHEAFEFISRITDSSYHVIICDFTYPTGSEETAIYSREWFQQVNRVLHPDGVMNTNGVSPENCTTGFWCLYQTLLSAELKVKPLQVAIPSFRHHGYGNWGFFLASSVPIERSEIETLILPNNLERLKFDQLMKVFEFESIIANLRHQVNIHTLACPQLFYYLLNPTIKSPLEADSNLDETVNFLDIQEPGTRIVGTRDLLQLESTAQVWIEQANQDEIDITQLLPVQHRYHSPKMTAEWLAYIKQLLTEIDLSRLFNCLLERAQELPPQVAAELKQSADKTRFSQQPNQMYSSTFQVIMLLSVTLLMANLLTPDAVFAKRSVRSSSWSDSTYYSEDGSSFTKFIGFLLTLSGGIWLVNLISNFSNNDGDD